MNTIIRVDETSSTNSLLSASIDKFAHGTAVSANSQTAGRGQRGNYWESEPGQNLTFSVLLRPTELMAKRQFELSQVVSISIVGMLRTYLETDEIYVKWPNDIYYRDSKICGILIENSLMGATIDTSIVGVGINVNQSRFESDAPNPISMYNIAGHKFDLEAMLRTFVNEIVSHFDFYEKELDFGELSGAYRKLLWRGEGYWPYRDTTTGEIFDARVAAIAPTGHITLATSSERYHTYAFKEVSALI